MAVATDEASVQFRLTITIFGAFAITARLHFLYFFRLYERQVKRMGKSFKDMTKEELQEAGKKGGVKSGKTRAAKKQMKDTFETILSMSLHKGAVVNIDKIKNIADIKGKNITVQDAILIAQVQKALKGSIASAEFIRDTVGQRPEDIINLNTEGEDMTLNINVSYGDEAPLDNSEVEDMADDEH